VTPKRRSIALASLGVLVALTAIAIARPGGGDSFSGGGGHGGGGSSGGDDGDGILTLIFHLLRLIIYYPKIGIPLVLVIIGWYAYSAYKNHVNKDWNSGPPVDLQRAVDVGVVKRLDPDFSRPVFEDFAFRLYATAHRARHDATQLAGLAPYVSAAVRDNLATRAPVGTPVTAVVVGAMRTVGVRLPQDATDLVHIELEFEANHAMADRTEFVVESWTLSRAAGVRTKPPKTSNIFPCPNCGAPWAAKDAGSQICASCNQAVDNGRFDWQVESARVLSVDVRGPTLTESPPERGTDLPTYRQQNVDRHFAELVTKDPAISRTALEGRVRLIHKELYTAWAANELGPARGLLTDGLYDYLQYWIDAYRAQGLRNRLEHPQVTRVEVAKVSSDRYFDAVTVRIWGEGLDYVERIITGGLVRGSKRKSRKYSEYWTLLRSTARTGEIKQSPVCGNCGGALKTTRSGECEFCGAHVTNGEFDWVLSKIEQDDSYRG